MICVSIDEYTLSVDVAIVPAPRHTRSVTRAPSSIEHDGGPGGSGLQEPFSIQGKSLSGCFFMQALHAAWSTAIDSL